MFFTPCIKSFLTHVETSKCNVSIQSYVWILWYLHSYFELNILKCQDYLFMYIRTLKHVHYILVIQSFHFVSSFPLHSRLHPLTYINTKWGVHYVFEATKPRYETFHKFLEVLTFIVGAQWSGRFLGLFKYPDERCTCQGSGQVQPKKS